MLKKFTLENFRCFHKTEITFRELSIIVGKNNAGKSTIIEALRILSLVVNKARSTHYLKSPEWLGFDDDVLGIQPSIKNLDISSQNIFHMYGDPPAKIFAEFDDGLKVQIFVGDGAELFATLTAADGKPIESKKFASHVGLQEINILPQITPLLKHESVIREETVQRNLATNLSSRHFRNQLNYYPKAFQRFKDLSEKTWPGLSIDSSITSARTQGDLLLFVRDNQFEAEIGWMGQGLQMWLQTMWFLSRCPSDSTVILDEPDVYMHADLQRRLIKLVKSHFKQVIVATHSVEIMSEVEAENILPISNSKRKQDYANKAPIVQKIIDQIGSVHNLEIARLFSYNKFLIVEGERDDVKMLSILQSKIFPDTFEQFDILPKTFVQGWGGWQRVIGSHKVFKDNQTNISTYCIFDSDYHTIEEQEERIREAEVQGINLHIWKKKEIENYLLVPSAIVRLCRARKKNIELDESSISTAIDVICEQLKDDVIDNFATEISHKDSKKALKSAYQEARLYVNGIWGSDKWSRASGKEILSRLSMWLAENHKVSVSRFAIAREMKLAEISPEVVELITTIENRRNIKYA
ncbi:ATP-dependent nuclease [Desertivirga brevis]|uniref:ATP-dependent nuclease n=1 Tax=Desertivirga brevis TaxID=2810310 RepID=UPI001A97519D|nr:ATP-binding protein [Pedobacter sp. SYSU D00873]